jgi:hypothetical protein
MSPTSSACSGTEGKAELSQELIRLAYLCQAGVLSETEFGAATARVLAEHGIRPPAD